jgi:hypothetical protein
MNRRHQPRPQLHFVRRRATHRRPTHAGESTTTSLASGCDDDHFLRVVLEVFSAPPAVESH